MEIKQISMDINQVVRLQHRPQDLETFVGQEHIKKQIRTAITSSQKRSAPLGHMLLSGPSGYGKTTLAHIIAQDMGKNIKAITAYAISKPAEIISILNALEEGDVLFIDEIHRLKPQVEEVLYIAMEDFVIDIVMPDGESMRLPVQPFTLIGATTKPESLTQPLKNRFVYSFHFMDYTTQEKQRIIEHYLDKHNLLVSHKQVVELMNDKVDSVPREIFNLCVKLRDYVISYNHTHIDTIVWENFLLHAQIDEGGMSVLHQKYLEILGQYDRAIGLRTIAVQLGMHEKAIEEDIEPLLLKLGKIIKTAGGRTLV
jgi:holliday junction DNA helicase RuvB